MQERRGKSGRRIWWSCKSLAAGSLEHGNIDRAKERTFRRDYSCKVSKPQKQRRAELSVNTRFLVQLACKKRGKNLPRGKDRESGRVREREKVEAKTRKTQ